MLKRSAGATTTMRIGMPIVGTAPPNISAEIRDSGEIVFAELEARIGRAHVAERLMREAAHESGAQRPLRRFFYADGWWSAHSVIRASLSAVGLHERARRNARRLKVNENKVRLPALAPAFNGFTLLH